MAISSLRISALLPPAIQAIQAVSTGPAPATSPVPTSVSQTDKPQTLVTTETFSNTPYTLTYVPSTVTNTTTFVEPSTTITANPGDVIGVLAAGAAAGALPEIIPEIIPGEAIEGGSGNEPEEDGDADNGDWCEKQTARICKEQCSFDGYVSEYKIYPTSSCASKTCSSTAGCSVTATTSTATASSSPQNVDVVDGDSLLAGPIGEPNLDISDVQVYLASEFERLGIDNSSDFKGAILDCEKGSLDDEQMDTTVVEDLYLGFCTDHDGSPIGIVGEIRSTTGEGDIQTTLSVRANLSNTHDSKSPKYFTSPGISRLKLDGSKDVVQPCLKQILPCGSEAKHTPGGNITVGNLKFSMQPYKATVQCNQEDDQAAVKISDARANFEDFCAKFDGQVIKGEDDPKSASYHQDVGSTMTTVSLSWAEDIDGCGADGLLYPPYNIMKEACENRLGHLLTDCNKDDADSKTGGNVTDTCVQYTLDVMSREKLFCFNIPGYSDEANTEAKPFLREDGLDTINDFCDRNLLVDPSMKDAESYFHYTNEYPEGVAKYVKHDITVEVTFPKDGISRGWCSEDTPDPRKFKTGGEECHRRLADVLLDGCNKQTQGETKGGFLEDGGQNGCVQWLLMHYDASGS